MVNQYVDGYHHQMDAQQRSWLHHAL
uniref:Uncharacterized protein n=1 Tax=Ciona intestinalis TaxID=7719 RepID=H2XT05_CIOIN